MKLQATRLAALTLFSLSLAAPLAQGANESSTAAANPAKVAATQAALRGLWVGHIFWVREVSRGLAEKNTAAAESAEQQAVANAKAIAGSIEPFYGKPASEQLFKLELFKLLAGHYTAIKAHAAANAAGKARTWEAMKKHIYVIADALGGALAKQFPAKF